jgi:hypothetical protein
MLEKGVTRAAQVLAPRVALLLFIKSAEYLVNPAFWSITGAAFLSI